MCSARVGSNPILVDSFFFSASLFLLSTFFSSRENIFSHTSLVYLKRQASFNASLPVLNYSKAVKNVRNFKFLSHMHGKKTFKTSFTVEYYCFKDYNTRSQCTCIVRERSETTVKRIQRTDQRTVYHQRINSELSISDFYSQI